MQLKPIIVATDLSDSAIPAARWAHDLGAHADAQVIVGHVFEIGFDSWWKSKYDVLMDAEKHTAATDAISAWYTNATDDVPTGAELRVDTCAHGLSDIVTTYDASLLAMSPSGKGGFMQAVVGSRVHEMVARPPCPVAVVRSDFTSGGTLGVATDFSDPSERAIRFAHDLASATGAKLQVITVAHKPETPALPNLFDELVGDLGKAMRKRLKGFVAGILGDAHNAELVVLEGDAVHKTLQAHAEKSHLTALVMGRTGHRSVVGDLVGSVPRALINHAPCTVIVTPAPAPPA